MSAPSEGARLVALALGAAATSCGGGTPTAAPPVPIASPAPPPQAPAPARSEEDFGAYVPSEAFVDIGGGWRGAVSNRRRIMIKGHQLQVVDEEPWDDLTVVAVLPETLGPGWLFTSYDTLLYAATFQGDLAAIAEGATNMRIGVGHQRLLLSSGDEHRVIALPSGREVAAEPAGLVELLGLADGRVAARTEQGALFFSKVPGVPLAPVDAAKPITGLGFDGTELVAKMGHHDARRIVAGVLDTQRTHVRTRSDNLYILRSDIDESGRIRPGPQERLHSIWTRLMTDEIAIALDGPDLLFLNALDASVVSRVVSPFDDAPYCKIIRGGVPAFVYCHSATFDLYRIDGVDKPPVKETTLEGVVDGDLYTSNDDLALVFTGPCGGPRGQGRFCVRRQDGSWQEHAFPGLDPLDVFGLEDGRVIAMSHDEAGGATITFVHDRRQFHHPAEKVPEKWHSREPAVTPAGFRWFTVGFEGEEVLSLAHDGTLERSPLEGTIAASVGRAIQRLDDGRLRLTVDAGQTFHDIAPPPDGAPDRVDCTDTGCQMGPWYRPGWSWKSAP